MNEFQRCPVCEGRGSVPIGFYVSVGVNTSTMPESCRTCSGKGIVQRPESEDQLATNPPDLGVSASEGLEATDVFGRP
jgi:hypothetical protein